MRTNYFSESNFLLDKQHVHIGATKKYYRLSTIENTELTDTRLDSTLFLTSDLQVLGGSK